MTNYQNLVISNDTLDTKPLMMKYQADKLNEVTTLRNRAFQMLSLYIKAALAIEEEESIKISIMHLKSLLILKR